jgi:hypothetical protein
MLLRIKFIVVLFLAALGALVGGTIDLVEKARYHFEGQPATMRLADPVRKAIVPSGGYDVHFLDVVYASAAGEVRVPKKRLMGDRARLLAGGAGIPVTYLRSDPERVYYAGEQPPLSWGLLAGGIALAAMGVVALRMHRREQAGLVPDTSRAGTAGLLILLTLGLGALTTYLFLDDMEYRRHGKVALVQPPSEYTETTTTRQRALRADDVRVTREARMHYVDTQGRTIAFTRLLNEETLAKFRARQPVWVEYIPGTWNRERFRGDDNSTWWFLAATLALAGATGWVLAGRSGR